MNDLLHAQDRVWTTTHINRLPSRFALFPAAQDVSSNETPRAARRCSNRAHSLHDCKAEHGENRPPEKDARFYQGYVGIEFSCGEILLGEES